MSARTAKAAPSTRDLSGFAADAKEIASDLESARAVLAEAHFLRTPWAKRGARRTALDIARHARAALDSLIDEMESAS